MAGRIVDQPPAPRHARPRGLEPGPRPRILRGRPRAEDLRALASRSIARRGDRGAAPVSQRIVLYGPRRTPYTEKVRRALVLKGLDFELCEPSGPEDYRRWSPETGLLPVLAIGAERVADSTRILLRIDELWPKPPLLSPDPV